MADESADAGTPPSGPQIVVERPPPGLARGKFGFPEWGIALIGACVLAAMIAWLVWRVRRSRR
jgi:hypothetical protein